MLLYTIILGYNIGESFKGGVDKTPALGLTYLNIYGRHLEHDEENGRQAVAYFCRKSLS